MRNKLERNFITFSINDPLHGGGSIMFTAILSYAANPPQQLRDRRIKGGDYVELLKKEVTM